MTALAAQRLPERGQHAGAHQDDRDDRQAQDQGLATLVAHRDRSHVPSVPAGG